MMSKNDTKECLEALRGLLTKGSMSTQEEIASYLANLGFTVNQSKISRMLRKVGASKTTDSNGNVIYCLPKDPGPPSKNTKLSELIVDIVHNEYLIVIFTSPGSASMISRIIDFQEEIGVLGTIAGDDTIFVTPKKVKEITSCYQKIRALLCG